MNCEGVIANSSGEKTASYNNCSSWMRISVGDAAGIEADNDSDSDAGVAPLITYYGLTYYPPILLLLCLVGNVINFIVIARVCVGSSVSVYFRWLSVFDTLAAYTYLGRVWIHTVFGVLLTASSDTVCRLVTFTNYTAGDVAIWVMMAITIDRLLAIVRPFVARRVCSSTGAVLVSAVLTLAAAAKNSTIWMSHRVVVTPRETRCTYDRTHRLAAYDQHVRPLFVLTISGLLPAVIVLGLNAVVITHLARHRRLITLFNGFSQHSTAVATIAGNNVSRDRADSPPIGRRKANRLFTQTSKCAHIPVEVSNRRHAEAAAIVIVLANSLMFCVMVLPQFVLNVFKQFHYSDELRAAQVFTAFLLYCNHSANFYISCLASHAYRRKLQVTFGCKKQRPKSALSSSVQPSMRSSQHLVVRFAEPDKSHSDRFTLSLSRITSKQSSYL